MKKRKLPPCPVALTVELIGNKWKLLIVRDLTDGTRRFSQLQKSIGAISQKVLTQNLRAMEQDGLVERKVYAEVPPRVEYKLSPVGKALSSVIAAMAAWGEKYRKTVSQTPKHRQDVRRNPRG